MDMPNEQLERLIAEFEGGLAASAAQPLCCAASLLQALSGALCTECRQHGLPGSRQGRRPAQSH